MCGGHAPGTRLLLCSLGRMEGGERFLGSVLIKRALGHQLLLVLYGTVGALNGCFGRLGELQSRGPQKAHLNLIVTWNRNCEKGLDQAGLDTHDIYTIS